MYGVIVNSIGTILSFKEQKNDYIYVSLWVLDMHVRLTVILNVSMNILSALDLLQTGKNAHQRSDTCDSPAAPQLWIG